MNAQDSCKGSGSFGVVLEAVDIQVRDRLVYSSNSSAHAIQCCHAVHGRMLQHAC